MNKFFIKIYLFLVFLGLNTNVYAIEGIQEISLEKGWKKSTWNRWVRDDLPEAFLSNLYDLESNQAYWVYSTNSTEFQGVLDVSEEGGSDELAFLDIVNRKTISLKNSSSQSISVVVSLEDNEVPLSLIGKNILFSI